jgi:acryloyl-coenzyme A reductase
VKAVLLHQFGPAENLRWTDVPDPVATDRNVVLRVTASGVCFHDVLNRTGHLPRTKLPAILGHEVSGVVVDVGSDVQRLHPGDRVSCLQRVNCGDCGLCSQGRPTLCRNSAGFFGEELQGGYGEYFLAPEHVLAHVPDGVPDDQAAVTACTLGTAVHALETVAQVTAGQVVLITGASGGVGIHAIQLAKLHGAHVVTVTGSERKSDALLAAGADKVIVAADLQFAPAVKTYCNGADMVLDIVGSATLGQSLKSLRNAGKLIVIGNVAGGNASMNPGLVILKELQIMGAFAASLRELKRAFDLVESGRIKILVSDRLPLRHAAEAHRRLERRDVAGRLVLQGGGG